MTTELTRRVAKLYSRFCETVDAQLAELQLRPRHFPIFVGAHNGRGRYLCSSPPCDWRAEIPTPELAGHSGKFLAERMAAFAWHADDVRHPNIHPDATELVRQLGLLLDAPELSPELTTARAALLGTARRLAGPS